MDWITSTIPQTGYIPGETYTITTTGVYSGVAKFGFELTAEDGYSKVGSFTITNAAGTKLTNSNNAVTHTSAGSTPSGDETSWSFDWTAPSEGTGDVTDALFGINCGFLESQLETAKTIEKNTNVKVKGECQGYIDDVILGKCAIIQ